ncbi:hypothetical protein [Streptomyces sp. NPDC006645]|uniref:hypothetical protein n=1 Tax=unclassified Streptomyces TaxID=2593676 RepID=UPI0033A2A780
MNNPPNHQPPPTAIGSQMVTEQLGIPPRQLGRLHQPDSAEGTLAQLVGNGARHLDHLHEQLTSRAGEAAANLTRVTSGRAQINSLGILQNTATQIDILAARRYDAIEHLNELILAYRHAAALPDAAPLASRQRGTVPAQEPSARPASERPSRRR